MKGGDFECLGNVKLPDDFAANRVETLVKMFQDQGETISDERREILYKESLRAAHIEEQAEIWKNSLFTVLLFKGKYADEMVHHPDIQGKCAWLSIKRNDKSDRIFWHEKMKMVQLLLGRDWLGIEIYPPYKFTVDTANQYHIICIPPDYVDGFPFGWKHREINDIDSKGGFGKLGQKYRGN